jgi:predicted dinucleotide-binding enzyme
MKVGILGTGDVGRALGTGFVALGHEVKIGGRSANHEKALEWVGEAGKKASQGTFADAARFGEIIVMATLGTANPEVVKAAGAKTFAGKVVIDATNPLDFSKGFPPTLAVCNTDSVGEQIQRAFPDVKVVKALNTVTTGVMVNPGKLSAPTDIFVAGNDAGAKKQVTQLLTEGFGWKRVVDLGDITGARATEGHMLLWLRLYGALGTPDFNVQIVKA